MPTDERWGGARRALSKVISLCLSVLTEEVDDSENLATVLLVSAPEAREISKITGRARDFKNYDAARGTPQIVMMYYHE
jgi:hypothetical protein